MAVVAISLWALADNTSELLAGYTVVVGTALVAASCLLLPQHVLTGRRLALLPLVGLAGLGTLGLVTTGVSSAYQTSMVVLFIYVGLFCPRGRAGCCSSRQRRRGCSRTASPTEKSRPVRWCDCRWR